MHKNRMIFICIIVGVLSSAAQAVLPLGGKATKQNLQDINAALIVANDELPLKQNLNFHPDSPDDQACFQPAATFNNHPRRFLNDTENETYSNVGWAVRRTNAGDLGMDTASVTGCPCVATSAARPRPAAGGNLG